MLRKDVPVKRKRGRPKKDQNLDFSVVSHEYNINSANVYPPMNIITHVEAEDIKGDTDLLGYLNCNYQSVFETLLDAFKGNENEINIVFTKSGLLLSQPFNDDHRDMVRYEAKIFPDRLTSYRMKGDRDLAVRMSIRQLNDIIKTIPKDVSFSLSLQEVDDQRFFRALYNVDDVGNDTDYIVTLSNFMGYDPIRCNTDEDYDVIFMMTAVEFERVCKKTLKTFAEMIEIVYQRSKGSGLKKSEVSFSCMKDSIDIKASYGQRKKFRFLKEPEKNTVSGKFNLSTFIKYTKCFKFSTMVKLYLSNTKPLIIEYDIKPGLGTLQVFVQSQNVGVGM